MLYTETILFSIGNGGIVLAAAEEEAASSDDADGILMDGMSKDDEAKLEKSKESFTFQAEVNRLMDIIINSLCELLLPTWHLHLLVMVLLRKRNVPLT